MEAGTWVPSPYQHRVLGVMSSQHAALQSTVVSCLTAILGSDQQQRKAAEDELKALEVTEEFGIVLVEVTVSTESPLVYRQLASIILKQYVEVHWSKLAEKFVEPMPSEETKVAIRRLLPSGLNDSQSKVRSTVAYAISAIAHWDWPENWPNLFDHLIPALGSGEPHLVHGTMRVLSEFCHDVSDHQMPHVAPVILPQLLKVIVQAQVYSARTRSRAVHIFNTTAYLVYAMSEAFPEAIKTLLLPVLPDFLAAFIHILSSSDPVNTDPGLVKEVIMTLCALLRSLPRALTPHIMQIVTPVWNLLVSSTPLYVRSAVNSVDPDYGEVCDSDGEVIGRERSTFAIFEFISVLSESSRLQRLLPPILPELVYYLIAHMQITEEQMHTWLDDVNQFVDEDENEFSYSIRLSAYELLQALSEEEGLCSAYYAAVVTAVERHLQETPLQSTEHWWKVHEACMLAVSCVVEAVKRQSLQFDCQTFAERILLPDTSVRASPLLTGRCLWLAAKLTTLLKPTTTAQVLQAVAGGLQPSQHGVIRVLAAKATYHCCSELQPTEHAPLLKPFLPHFLECLAEMAGSSHDDVIPLVVDSLHLVSQVDRDVTAQCSARLVPITMALFLKYSHDPGISLSVEELFEALASNPGCHADLHSRFLPTAVEILRSNESQLPLGLVAAVLDVLVPLVRGCESGGLPEVFITEVFPCVVQRVLGSDDSSVLQNGGECVRAFVSTGVEQLARWVDSSQCSGLHYVVQVIVHLLDPSRPEFSASFVGKLIITFVKKAGNVLGEHLELLLRSVLSKMQSVDTPSVMQSLLLVFGHLIQTELESVVSFLSQVPDPRGRPALEFVMVQWCARHSSFFGVYETRVSSLALSKLLTHCVGTGDERLAKITVDGEEVVVHSEGIQTRSKRAAAPQQWTKVPLPVKLLKLLISDVQNAIEAQTAGQQEDEEGSDEEEDDDGWGSDLTSIEALLAPASDFPGFDAVGGEDWEREEDPDLVDEPVLQMDMQAHLVGYLAEFSRQPCFASFLQTLTDYEKHTLKSIGVL